jgi:glutamate 5-kinase
MGVVPIVNENDTVSVAEIKFGDNDTLSAITANMVKADILILLTDVECMYTANPKLDPSSKPIYQVKDMNVSVDTKGGSDLGTGGMVTKIISAKLATAAGIHTVISSGKRPDKIPEIIRRVFGGLVATPEFQYTHFLPSDQVMKGMLLCA